MSETPEPRLTKYRGKYYVVWYDGPTRKRISTGTTDQKSAQRALIDFIETLDNHPRQITMTECLERYIASREGKVQALKRLKDAALQLNIFFGIMRVDQVNQRLWDQYAVQRYKKTKFGEVTDSLVSSGTLKREFNVLLAALRRAWKDDLLAKPPALEGPRDSAPRDKYLTKTEAKKLLEACETPHLRMFVALGVYTGARRGAILSLTWDRVNFETGLIDFQEPGRVLTAKRRSIVPMTRALREELHRAFQMREGPYVVQYNGRPVPNGVRWSFKKACVRAGLDWMPTPHHMKHSVASWMAMDGVPIDQAADWLATDPRTLRRVYRKFDPSYLKSIADRFSL